MCGEHFATPSRTKCYTDGITVRITRGNEEVRELRMSADASVVERFMIKR